MQKSKTSQLKVAIYARVSKDDDSQHVANQLLDLRTWCDRAGHSVAAEYVDRQSGAGGEATRAQFRTMMGDAQRHQFDLVLVWALDRFSREGLTAVVMYLHRLNSYGVAFHSYTEEYLSSGDPFMRDAFLGIIASLAKRERERVSERTKAGLRRAKAQGKRLGQKPLSENKRKAIERLWNGEQDISINRISKKTGVSYNATWRYIQRLK